VIGKTVKYDNPALYTIAASIPWEQAQQVFKIEFDVAEKTLKSLEDEDLKKRIAAARTVKYGEPKITSDDE
jgi:hypothetical protein